MVSSRVSFHMMMVLSVGEAKREVRGGGVSFQGPQPSAYPRPVLLLPHGNGGGAAKDKGLTSSPLLCPLLPIAKTRLLPPLPSSSSAPLLCYTPAPSLGQTALRWGGRGASSLSPPSLDPQPPYSPNGLPLQAHGSPGTPRSWCLFPPRLRTFPAHLPSRLTVPPHSPNLTHGLSLSLSSTRLMVSPLHGLMVS